MMETATLMGGESIHHQKQDASFICQSVRRATLGGTNAAEEPYPEPWWPGLKWGDWDTFSERFKNWEIAEFEYRGGAADGGSRIFEFKSSEGAKFDVMVACSERWTKEDWKKKEQPIYLLFEDKAYRVSKGSEPEKILLLKLRQAASDLKGIGYNRPRFIGRLHDLVESRDLQDYCWPFGDLELEGESGNWNKRVNTLRDNNWTFDRLDLEGASGDWSRILEKFKKWEIVEFSDWDTLGDRSTVFQFVTADDSEIGILVPTIPPHFPRAELNVPFEKRAEPIVFPQVIFLYFKKELYRVENGSENEALLLAMLDQAAKRLKSEGLLHPRYIECLRGVVKSRVIPPFDEWPLDHYLPRGPK